MFANTVKFCLVSALLIGSSQAAMTSGFIDARMHDSMGGLATCITGIVPLEDVSSPMNYKLNAQVPQTQIEVTQDILSLQYSKIGGKLTEKILGKTHKVTASVNISSTLCVPKKNMNDSKAIQLLTHGVGFDHGYWDFMPGLSYVDVAAQYGASTFSYDRVGVGSSSTPGGDAPLQVIQAPMEVAILDTLVKMLKNGDFADTKYPKVVSTGHSFGSALTVGLASTFPNDIDAAILTGFTVNSTAVPFFTAALNLEIASINNPLRFGHLSKGYLVSQNVISNQFDFFHYPGFSPEALNLAELSKQTVTMGELITLSSVVKPATKFRGPVYVANGKYDVPFCLGDCAYPSDQGAAVPKMLFPNAGAADSKLYAAAGHGLNLHKVAPEAFNDIQKFIKMNGL